MTNRVIIASPSQSRAIRRSGMSFKERVATSVRKAPVIHLKPGQRIVKTKTSKGRTRVKLIDTSVPKAKPVKGVVAVTRGTPTGTITVTSSGNVTERDSKGKIIKGGRFQTTREAARQFLSRESKAIEKEVEARRKIKASSIPILTTKKKIQEAFKKSKVGKLQEQLLGATFQEKILENESNKKKQEELIKKIKTGEVRAAPKMTLKEKLTPSGLRKIIQKQREKELLKAQKVRSKASMQQIVGRQLRGISTLAAFGAGRAGLSVVETFTNPVGTAKGIAKAVSHPVLTAKAMGKEFTIDPVGTITEFYVYSKLLGLVGKSIKRSRVGRFVQEETFIRSMPKEIRPNIRKIIKGIKAQEKLNPRKIEDIKAADFMEVKTLSKLEAQALKRTIEKTDSVIFGSLSSRTIAGKRSKLPIPKDVDLATKNVAEFGEKFIKELPKKIRKNYLLKGEKIIRKTDGRALFDIKPLNRLIPERSLITKRGRIPVSGFVLEISDDGSILPKIKRKKVTGAITLPTQKLVKIEGLKFTSFGEQTTRKGLGTIQVLIEKNARRAKDPQSLLIGLETQLEALLEKKQTFFVRQKISSIKAAIKMLKSKEFSRLLEKKVPGLTEEYPLISKIDKNKLKKINLETAKRTINKIKRLEGQITKLKEQELPRTELARTKLQQRIKNIESELVRTQRKNLLPRRLPSPSISRLPSSEIPSEILSEIPSKIPSQLGLSNIPGLKPSIILLVSKIPKITKSSRIPSKLPKAKTKIPSAIPSKIPSKLGISKIPGIKPSFIPLVKLSSRLPPSRLPKREISKLPKNKSSKIPKLKPSKIPFIKRKKIIATKKTIFPDKQKEKKLKKELEKEVRKRNLIFIPDLYSKIYGIKATKAEKLAFLKIGRIFTGIERRKIV